MQNPREEDDDDEEEEEEAVLQLWGSVFWLAVVAGTIALLSEYVVDAIEVRVARSVTETPWFCFLPVICVLHLYTECCSLWRLGWATGPYDRYLLWALLGSVPLWKKPVPYSPGS